MRVTSLSLRNFKCYGEAELGLENGVTVVHGVNGSGKSTLLEGVFFALYGSKALDDRTLGDVITTGEDETEVELSFTHAGVDYHIHRVVKRRGDRATTTTCILETPEGDIEGARDVRAEVTRLLRMDADAFVNCAYVRQGEVNKLIHASPRERQDMIDDLLQLGALEEYRERASEARLGVKDVLDRQEGRLEQLREQIDTKEAKNLHERLNGLESRRNELIEEIEEYDTHRQAAEETLESARDTLERHEETQEEIQELTEEIDSLRSKITDSESTRESLLETLSDLESQREALGDERETLLEDLDLAVVPEGGDDSETEGDAETVQEAIDRLEEEEDDLRDRLEEVKVEIERVTGEIERLRERADELEADAEAATEEAADIEESIAEDEAALTDREADLEDLEVAIEDKREQFAAAPIDFGEAADRRAELESEREEVNQHLADVSAKIDATEASIEEGEALLEEGKCPECGQPVADSPHVDVLEERRETLSTLESQREDHRERLETVDERLERATELADLETAVERLEERRETAEQLISQRREAIEERRNRHEAALERARECSEEATAKREQADEHETELAEARKRLGSINSERATLRERLETLERIAEITRRVQDLEREADGVREKRANTAELIEERRTRLTEKRDQKRDLEAEFDAGRLEAAKEELRNAEAYLEQVEPKLAALEESREGVQNAIGAVENELEELENLRTDLEGVTARCDRLQSLYDEAETLQTTYGELRAELRQRNVETLERLLNETFDLVYQNDSYAAIELDGEYRLTVYQKDGEALEPEQLSGGERALFNLSLRCAIYRLLAEGVEGAAPMPPLILDEPTVFLDSGHVTQLVSLIESMRQLGVEQIVVVSHDEELVGAADDLVRVEKDATSNRSRLERGEPPEASLLAGD